MSAFWTTVVYAYVLGTLAAVMYGLYRMFGGGHRS